MSFLTDMLSKLPDMFKKTSDSTIGKLFTIVSDQIDDLQNTLNTMEEWRDIDEAEGVVLDRIGQEILQEPRGGVSDEEYRLKLKTRIIVNYLSDGDIETLIKLLEVYLGDHLVSVQTAANVKEGPFAGEPATLLITINGHDTYGIPFEELAKVLTGGVGTQWQYLLERLTTIQNDYERWMYPFENYAGNLIAGGDQVSNDNRLYASNFELDDSYSKAMNAFPICGDFPEPFPNLNVDTASSLELSGSYSSALNEYMVCLGDNPNDTRDYESDLTLNGVYTAIMQPYPICGEFTAGEVV
jgi:hypothetical protein